jgi:sporulation protein YlmC with PRC-barrel domain
MTLVRLSALSLSALLAVAAAPPAAAQAASAASAAMTPADRHDWERTHRASRIVGSEVRSRGGEKIGDIRDLVLDDHSRIALAIVSTGSFLGVGERLHAVPWDLLSLGTRDDRVLDIDKARLKAIPGFTPRNWPDLNDEHWQADNRRNYIR